MFISRTLLLVFVAWVPTANGVHGHGDLMSQGDNSGKPRNNTAHRAGKPGSKQVMKQAPTETDPRGESAAEMSGVQANGTGDLPVFLTGLATNGVTLTVFFVVFSILRRKIPIVYAGRVQASDAPFEPSDSFFGWVAASLKVRMEDVVHHCGLDQALMLEFSNFGVSLLSFLAVPLLFVMGPLHAIFGGDRSGDDHLSKLGMANVVDNHPWLYWVHSVLVWFVVVTVQHYVYKAQGRFLERRKEWLQTLPSPRATTVLVQNIPEKHCTDKKIKEYFDHSFGAQVVESAFVVKHTGDLVQLIQEKEGYSKKLEEALFKEKTTDQRPTMRDYNLAQVDTIDFYTARLNESSKAIKDARKSVQEGIDKSDPAYFTCNAFVTFKSRRFSEIALSVAFTADGDEFVCEVPPDPADVIYDDLKKDRTRTAAQSMAGYGMIAFVFWAYMPAVIGIAYVTDLNNLAKHFSFFKGMAADDGTVVMWDAMMGSLALELFVSFVPSFFVYIFTLCFALKASAWLQHRIQNWYFWFLVVYVLLVTAVGSSVIATLDKIIESPTYVFALLATTMPFATHFYLNYIPLQWVTHGQNMLRMVQLAKFYSFKAVFEEDVAKSMAEPENQDYYGIGSRSARHSFILVLALVYCSLTPLITVLALINCFICRVVYGYLVVFTEIRKPDLGGVFWVTNLMNVQRCMLIYITLMAGVLCFRDSTYGPCIIAGSSVAYWHFSFARFERAFRWQSLAIEDVRRNAKPPTPTAVYKQPELME